MRRYLFSSLFVVFSMGCGDSDSITPANNGGAPLNNVSAADLLSNYGTEGPIDTTGKSRDGFAYCNLAAIKTDDLASDALSTDVPAVDGGAVIPDSAARCGDDDETAVWRLMNCERIGRQIAPVDCDLRMVYLGRAHSADMSDRSYFDHTSPDGKTPFDRLDTMGVSWRSAGENIALNPTAEGAHLSWMDSEGHRSNILGDSNYAGCGVVGSYYTTVFIHD